MIVLYLELFFYSWVPAEEDMLVLTTFILRSSDNIFIVILVQDQRNKGAGDDNKFASCIAWDIFSIVWVDLDSLKSCIRLL